MTDLGAKREALLDLSIPFASFSADWGNCDRIATYMARQVSYSRTDPAYYANLMSSVLNELLEMAFKSGGLCGDLCCSILSEGKCDRVALAFPASDGAAKFLQASVAAAREVDAGDRYRTSLLSSPLDPAIGLFELALDYQANLEVEVQQDNRVFLAAEFALEDHS